MLECRIGTAGLGEEQVTVKTTRGCPQGGVLSPLLWSLVIDKLLNDLDRQGFEVIGIADDLVITV
jgi:retron-type reverse transcriptase